MKNRIVMPPMCTAFATSQGAVTDRLVEYYRMRAKGGVGLVNVEFSYVHPTGKVFDHMLGIYNDNLIPGLQKLAAEIRNAGAKAVIQISHAGRRTHSEIIGVVPVAPSPVPRLNGEVPSELSINEIGEIVQQFTAAAVRAKVSGFDGVMIHMAHGYLIHQFLSPLSNKRQDEYGGDLANRSRFAVDIVDSIRKEIGNDFTITCRLCGDEFIKGGINIKEAVETATIMECHGVDAIEVSAGTHETPEIMNAPGYFGMGFLEQLSLAIKQKVRIPIGIVGRIHDPGIAESIIERKKADFVAVGRGLIADPEWPNKAWNGMVSNIRPCISCNQGCVDRMYLQQDISCTVNPSVGRELTYPVKQADQKRKVLVLGGGPAGLQAAIIAAQRGHIVNLYEKADEFGGQLRIAQIPPGKSSIEAFRKYLLSESKRLGVRMIQKSLSFQDIIDEDPDYIIVAVGGRPRLLKIPGINNRKVVTAWEILGKTETVENQVLIIGGGQVGLETADFLTDKVRSIIILEMRNKVGIDMSSRARKVILKRLAEKKVDIITRAQAKCIEENAVVYDRGGVINRIEPLQRVVLAVGTESEKIFLKDLERLGKPIKIIGDCLAPRSILTAIQDGFLAGMDI